MHTRCSNVDDDCSASPTPLVYRWIQQGVGALKPYCIAQTVPCGFLVNMILLLMPFLAKRQAYIEALSRVLLCYKSYAHIVTIVLLTMYNNSVIIYA